MREVIENTDQQCGLVRKAPWSVLIRGGDLIDPKSSFLSAAFHFT